jgi:hypothetical protein
VRPTRQQRTSLKQTNAGVYPVKSHAREVTTYLEGRQKMTTRKTKGAARPTQPTIKLSTTDAVARVTYLACDSHEPREVREWFKEKIDELTSLYDCGACFGDECADLLGMALMRAAKKVEAIKRPKTSADTIAWLSWHTYDFITEVLTRTAQGETLTTIMQQREEAKRKHAEATAEKPPRSLDQEPITADEAVTAANSVILCLAESPDLSRLLLLCYALTYTESTIARETILFRVRVEAGKCLAGVDEVAESHARAALAEIRGEESAKR